jgi:hypothetical protein
MLKGGGEVEALAEVEGAELLRALAALAASALTRLVRRQRIPSGS